MAAVTLCECFARDGLQHEPQFIPTETKRALVERFGIAASRLTGAGFGAAQPKATNDTIEGRAKNRRVELVRQ